MGLRRLLNNAHCIMVEVDVCMWYFSRDENNNNYYSR